MSEKKRLRIRDIFIKYPLLDKARIYSFVWIFEHGITWFDRRGIRLMEMEWVDG